MRGTNEDKLSAYAFWALAPDDVVIDALAWRRDHREHSEHSVYVAATETCVTLGQASPVTLGQLRSSFARYAPADACPQIVLVLADPCPAELVAHLRDRFARDRIRGAWYRRSERVSEWIERVRTAPAPQYMPQMPRLEPEDRWRYPANSYQRRIQRAEALATVRQMMAPAPEPTHASHAPAWQPGDPCPIVRPDALVGYGSGLSREALATPSNAVLIPTAQPPEGDA